MARKDYQVFAAVPTIFGGDEEIDPDGTRAVLENIQNGGVSTAFVGGTTAEFAALSIRERVHLFELGVEVFGADSVVAHVGAPSAFQATALTAHARSLGIERFAAISPFFHPSVRSGVLDYYRRVADAAQGGGVYIYTYAELTGVAVGPDFLSELAAIPGVIGTKVSAQPLSDLPPLIAAVPEDFEVLWGNDNVFDEVTALGGTGTVSGVSSVFPEVFAAWAKALKSGNDEEQRTWAERAHSAVASVSCGIGGLKRGLSLRGFGSDATRIPTASPTPEQHALIEAQIALL